jgi:hypothetical protein
VEPAAPARCGAAVSARRSRYHAIPMLAASRRRRERIPVVVITRRSSPALALLGVLGARLGGAPPACAAVRSRRQRPGDGATAAAVIGADRPTAQSEPPRQPGYGAIGRRRHGCVLGAQRAIHAA